MENEKNNEKIKNIGNGTLRFADESTKIIKAHNLAPTKYVFRAANGKANVLKILDTTAGSNGKWAIRIDRGHAKGATTPHINLNSKLTGITDPHIRVPNGAVKAAEFVNSFSTKMQSVNKILLPIAIAIDTARIGNAVYKDYKNDGLKKQPKETIKTTSSVAGGWSGGFLGGWAGGQSGTLAGGAIGACFGGFGVVPGAAIGCILGSITGAITGGIGGSFAAEKIAEKICDEVFDESKDSLDNIIIYITTEEKNHNLNFFAIDSKKAAVIEDLSFEISDVETFLSEFPKTFKDKTKTVIFNLTNFENLNHSENSKFCEKFMENFSDDTIYKFMDDSILFITTVLIAIDNSNSLKFEDGNIVLIANIYEERNEYFMLECINKKYEILNVKCFNDNDPISVQLDEFVCRNINILIPLKNASPIKSHLKSEEIFNFINKRNCCQSVDWNSNYEDFFCDALIEISKEPDNCKYLVTYNKNGKI